jgi:hypothetical protein
VASFPTKPSVETRRWDKCGRGEPIHRKIDVEQEFGDVVVLGNIETGSPTTARLIVSSQQTGGGLLLKFAGQEDLRPSTTLEPGTTAELVVDRNDLLRACAAGPIPLRIYAEFVLSVPGRAQSRSEVAVVVTPVTSLPPDVEVFGPKQYDVDAGSLKNANPWVLAELHFRDRPTSVPYEGPPVSLQFQVRDGAGYLMRCVKQDSLEPPWQSGSVPLEINLPLGAQTTMALEIAWDVGVLQARLRSGAERDTSFVVQQRRVDSDGQIKDESVEHAFSSHIVGELLDSLELRTATSRLTHRLPAGLAPIRFNLPPIRALQRENSGPALPKWLQFHIVLDSGHDNWILTTKATLSDSGASAVGGTEDKRPMKTGEPALLTISLARLISDLAAKGRKLREGNLVVDGTIQRVLGDTPPLRTSDPTYRFEVVVPILIDWGTPGWYFCIDFGTSAIALSVRRNAGTAPGSVMIPLGDWFDLYDINHDEGKLAVGLTSEAQEHIPRLLPSYVGLSSDLNLRADYDPISLGDLALASADSEGVKRRLSALQRTYDVSVPFPSRGQLPDFYDSVVFHLKRRMIEREPSLRPGAKFRALDNGVLELTESAKISTLLPDCFAELGGYVVNRAVRHAINSKRKRKLPTREVDILTDFERASLNDAKSFGVVVTHPFGIDAERIAIYREAGRRFLASFTACDSEALGPVILIPEALAAARYGIQIIAERRDAADTQFVMALDIGAGTYDVTIVEVRFQGAAPRTVSGWTIHNHFGMTVGGNDLDEAIARRVIDILRKAAEQHDIADVLSIEHNLADSPSRITRATGLEGQELRRKQTYFLRALQRSKVSLSNRLRRRSAAYQWESDADGSLDIILGGFDLAAGTPAVWPGRNFPSSELSLPITGEYAKIIVKRDDGTPSITLRVEPRALNATVEDDQGNVAVSALLDVLGTWIPRLAVAGLPAEAQRTTPIWIVTGRAALWPPLFSMIAKEANQSSPKGHVLTDRPFPAEEMKRAVLDGATQLAAEPKLALDAVLTPALAIIKEVSKASDEPLVVLRHAGQSVRISGGGRCSITRLLPGFEAMQRADRDSLVAAFARTGRKPWWSLTEIEVPEGGSMDVVWELTQSGPRIKTKGSQDEDWEEIPVPEDRIYDDDWPNME